MIRHLLGKLLMLVPTLFGVALVSFALVHMIPGDPVSVLAGTHAMSPAEHAAALHRLGLDRPLPEQFAAYLGRALHGDFGTSLVTGEPVAAAFATRLPATLELSAAAMALALLVGLPAGVVAALRRGRWPDHLTMTASLAGYSMPVFWWGLLLMLLFSVKLMWLPSGGMGTFRHIILPAVVLGTASTGIIARMTRSSMLDVLRQDYITTAAAKGLTRRLVVNRHALRNALIPTVTVVGLQFGQLLAGAVLTETVFTWPGIGRLLVTSILARDLPVVQAALVIIALLFVFVNLAVDILYAVLDPRIRYE